MSHIKILSVDPGGVPRDWITWENAVKYYVADAIVWQYGNNPITITGGHDHNGNVRTVVLDSIIATKGIDSLKAVDFDRNRHPSRRLLFARDRHICVYCGNVFEESKLTKEHIFPESKGGPSTWMNLVTACGRCNHSKEDKLLKETGRKLLYQPYIPNRNEMMILSNPTITPEQHHFLMTGVPKTSRLRDENVLRRDRF